MVFESKESSDELIDSTENCTTYCMQLYLDPDPHRVNQEREDIVTAFKENMITAQSMQ